MQTAGGHQRLFVAIRVPDDLKVELARAQEELKSLLPPKSTAWTKPDNVHLTLRFLGNVRDEHIPQLARTLGSSLADFGAMPLVCERLGCFPDLRHPRVIWAWVHDDAGSLERLHALVNEAVAGFAEKPAEKRFEGHVTLARPKRVKPHDAERLAVFVRETARRKFGNWSCSEVELIRSEPDTGGSRYTTLETVKL